MSNRLDFVRSAATNVLEIAAKAPKVAGATGLSFGRYVIANLWTLLPMTIAFLVFAAAIATTRVPDGCAERGAISVNWFLCTGRLNAVEPLLDTTKGGVQTVPGQLPKIVSADETLAAAKVHPNSTPSKTDIMQAAREGTARILWSVAYMTLLLVATVVILAAALLTGQGLLGHARAMAGRANAKQADFDAFGLVVARLVQFVLLSLIILAVAFFAVLKLAGFLIGDNLTIASILSSLGSNAPIFTDAIMVWLDKNVDSLHRLMVVGGRMLLVSVVLLALLVSSTLYQSPDDSAFRSNGTGSAVEGASYLRYLGRSFRRVKLAIYLGAALLVTLTAEISAQYNWALSYLDDDPGSPLGKSLTTFSQQVTTSIGLGFTLVLAALYFPAIVLIRERARDYYRARHPVDSLQQQDAFLTEQGLIVSVPSSYSDFLALLAPLAAASATKLFSMLGQQ